MDTNSKVSALMDGELEPHESEALLRELGAGGDARETWRSYHLIGDAMRDTRLVSKGFAARVAAQLAAEPTVLAPRRRALAERWPSYAAIAAGVAAVAFTAGIAFRPQDASVAPTAQGSATQEVAQVAPPAEANDYLLAHQGYSPRNSLQGVAPYVRLVSEEAPRKR